MPRNTLVSVTALIAFVLLITAALGAYQLFSYLAAGLVVAMIAIGSLEHGDREFDLAPYGALAVGLGILFAIGYTGIWLLWSPGVSEYTYVLGLPEPTLVYLVFIWLLPISGALYYSAVFESVGSEAVVNSILTAAATVQQREDLPLAAQNVGPSEGSAAGTGGDDTGVSVNSEEGSDR